MNSDGTSYPVAFPGVSYTASKGSLAKEERRSWDRNFKQVERRYRDFALLPVVNWPSWDCVRHAQELRHALVHNQGQYTKQYLTTRFARRPTEEELLFALVGNDGALVDKEVIPLSREIVDGVVAQLLAVATQVRDALLDQPILDPSRDDEQ